MKAKKSFGQHFLTEEESIDKIIKNFIDANHTRRAVEVGPGMGVLTKRLLAEYPDLVAVDADRDMADYLRKNIPELNLVEADFLKVDLRKLMHEKPFGIIGNFPYNISSQIVFKMLECKDLVPVMVGMFQKEMAERIVASPGKKTYGVISVLTQAYYEGHVIFTLKPEAFNPPPKVNSAVIILTRKESPVLDYDEVLFKEIVKTSFQQRRKMIRNTLKPFLTEEQMKDTFFERRPETLHLEEFIQLTKIIKTYEPRS